MTPEQARQIALTKLNGPVIEPIIRHIHARIKDAAEQGRFQITHPFHGLHKWPSSDEENAVWLALQREGWIVKHFPDPDPGFPGSCPYTTISW